MVRPWTFLLFLIGGGAASAAAPAVALGARCPELYSITSSPGSTTLDSQARHFSESLFSEGVESLGTKLDKSARLLPTLGEVGDKNQVDVIRSWFASRYPGKTIRLSPPKTAGLSGNPVWMVDVESGPRLVVKLYERDPLFFAKELAAEHGLKELTEGTVDITTSLDAFRFERGGKTIPALVMTEANGLDAKVTLQNFLKAGKPDAAAEAGEKVAIAIGEVHRRSLLPRGKSAGLADYVTYESDKVRSILDALPENPRLRAYATPEELAALKGRGRAIAQAFADPGPKYQSVVHGDLHGGNVIVGQKTATLIDVENAAMTMLKGTDGKITGRADPLADVGRFLEDLVLTSGDDPKLAAGNREVTERFLGAYAEKTGIPLDEVERGIEFHRLRYDLVQLSGGPQSRPGFECLALNEALKRMGIRKSADASPCR